MTRQKPRDGGHGVSRTYRYLVEGHKRLSSATYVVGELYMSRQGGDGERIPEIRRSAIPVRTPSRCGHTATVCAECAETWMSGWVLRFQRTVGGRRLRDELGGEKALAAIAERRNQAEGATARMEGTVAGVPVNVEVADGELVITVGRFGPAAAGRLDIDPRSVTATLRVAVAGENGNAARPGRRAYFNIYPDSAAGAGVASSGGMVNAMRERVPGHPGIRQGRSLDSRFRNTAELSGELSKGDVVVVGEVALAVAGRGWTPVRGGLTVVRTSEHGTRPLPGRGEG